MLGIGFEQQHFFSQHYIEGGRVEGPQTFNNFLLELKKLGEKADSVYEYLIDISRDFPINKFLELISTLEFSTVGDTNFGKKIVADFFYQKEVELYNNGRYPTAVEKLIFLLYNGDLRKARNLEGDKVRSKEAPYTKVSEKYELYAIISRYLEQKKDIVTTNKIAAIKAKVARGEHISSEELDYCIEHKQISLSEVLSEIADVFYNLFQYQSLDKEYATNVENWLVDAYKILGISEHQAVLLTSAKYFARLLKNSGKNQDVDEKKHIEALLSQGLIPNISDEQISDFKDLFYYLDIELDARYEQLSTQHNRNLFMNQRNARI